MSEEVIGFYDSTSYYNKIEKNAVYFIEQLKKRGNNVLVFANEESPFYTALSDKSIPLSVVDETKKYVNLILSFRLARAVKKAHCNILVILRPHDLITAIMAKTLFNRNLKLVFFQQIKFRLRKNYILYSLLFKPFDNWIVSMENYGKQVIELSNYQERKLVYLPPGIDLKHYKNDTLSKKSARRILKLPDNIELIGILGRSHIKHRQDFLIRAIQLLRKHKYDVDLLVMGKSEDKSEKEYTDFLKELAVECGIEEFIHFRSYNEKEVTFFKAIDIYAHNTDEELNGNHILKAMVFERPVIAHENEDISELLGKGKYGMIFQKGDLEDFTAKITRLLTQQKIRNFLITEAKNIVYEKYDIRKRCDKFESVIDQLTSTR